jgi:hypothetical protein
MANSKLGPHYSVFITKSFFFNLTYPKQKTTALYRVSGRGTAASESVVPVEKNSSQFSVLVFYSTQNVLTNDFHNAAVHHFENTKIKSKGRAEACLFETDCFGTQALLG